MMVVTTGTPADWIESTSKEPAGDSRHHVSNRALQLFEYLRAVKGLTEPPARDLSDYKQSIWWTDNLPVGDGCYLAGAGRNPEAWLEVRKQQIPPAPEPPVSVRPWLTTKYDSPDQVPSHAEQLE